MTGSSIAEPSVTVVIPARNETCYIQRALTSVTAQRWPLSVLEVVVVDNGSTDGTSDVVRSFMVSEPDLQIRLIDEPTPGRAVAKNLGARVAKGQWLIFLDADSCMAPNLVRQIIARTRAGYPAGSIAVMADSGGWLDHGFFELLELGKRLFDIRAQMFYCSRELFEIAGGFKEELRLAEDSEFLNRLKHAGVPVCHVTEGWITTSPRRLHSLPFRLGMLTTFVRWALAQAGIGRRWRY